jgi:hypothetical protein
MEQPSKAQAQRILQEVPRDKAFHFYTEIDSPTGAFATGLVEFRHIIKMVDGRSLEFHTARGDFENWIRMLGDEMLARQFATVRAGNLKGEALRGRLLQLLRLRWGQLRKTT